MLDGGLIFVSISLLLISATATATKFIDRILHYDLTRDQYNLLIAVN